MGTLNLKVKKRLLPSHYVGHKKVKRDAELHRYKEKERKRLTVYKKLLIANGVIYEFKTETEKQAIIRFLNQNSFGIEVSYDLVTLTFPWWKIGDRAINPTTLTLDLESLSVSSCGDKDEADK